LICVHLRRRLAFLSSALIYSSSVTIRDNVVEVGKRVVMAARRAARDPDSITVMAVSKTFPATAIVEAYDAGVRVFGENRVQEFAEKHAAAQALTGADFHLIGHLQSNKAAKAAELFHAVDSVDSLKLAEKLNAAAAKTGKVLRVLIEINVGGEEAKSGLAPGASELEGLLRAAPNWPHLAIRGLMTIPPFTEDPEGARPYFRRLRELGDQIAARNLPNVHMDVLSMGMSHDFEIAIEEGSTCVRVGTAIFGTREKP
jgi:pyridoxal phosphate enzyme (YggS family)